MLISEFKNTFFLQYKYIAEHVSDYTFYAHLHDLFEFLFVKSGSCVLSFEGNSFTLKEGEAFMIPPWHLHSIDASQAEDMYIFTFSSFCIPCSEQFQFDEVLLPYRPSAAAIELLYTNLIQKQCTDPFLLFSVVNFLMSDYIHRQESRAQNSIKTKENDLIPRALSFMKDHFKEDLTLSNLAKCIGCNPSYLSRLLNADNGLGFSGYLNAFRFSHAETLLRTTNKPIREIAKECGFGSIRSFNRIFFSRYQKKPTELRKQEKGQYK